MAQGRDTARHILGLGQAAIGISLASNFHDLLVAGNLPQRVGVGNASQDCIGGNPRRRQFHGQLAVRVPPFRLRRQRFPGYVEGGHPAKQKETAVPGWQAA